MVNKGKKRIEKLKTSSTLLLTKGKGDDIEEDEVEDEEKLEEDEPLKKKGNVIITKPIKISTIVLTRRATRKKLDKEGGDVIFK